MKILDDENVRDLLRSSLSIIDEVFVSKYSPKIRVSGDPETNEEWVVVEVFASGTVDEVIEQYKKYVKRWVDETPYQNREWVRLDVTPI